MPWYMILLVICLIIGPFDALYMYIKAGRRRDALRRKRQEKEKEGSSRNTGEGG